MLYDYRISINDTYIHVHSKYAETQPDYSGFPKECPYRDTCVNVSPDVIYGGEFVVDKTWRKLVYVSESRYTFVTDLPFVPEEAALLQKGENEIEFLFAHDGLLELVTVKRDGSIENRRPVSEYDRVRGAVWNGVVRAEIVYEFFGELYRLGLEKQKLDTPFGFEELYVLKPSGVLREGEFYVYKARDGGVVLRHGNKAFRYPFTGYVAPVTNWISTFPSTKLYIPRVYSFTCTVNPSECQKNDLIVYLLLGKVYVTLRTNELSTDLLCKEFIVPVTP